MSILQGEALATSEWQVPTHGKTAQDKKVVLQFARHQISLITLPDRCISVLFLMQHISIILQLRRLEVQNSLFRVVLLSGSSKEDSISLLFSASRTNPHSLWSLLHLQSQPQRAEFSQCISLISLSVVTSLSASLCFLDLRLLKTFMITLEGDPGCFPISKSAD